nr:class I SAM-dependent methyltransferase [Nocardia arthritidis]
MRIDLGTGDGRAVLAAAAADPEVLVIGVDANASAMAEASRRALRGGPSNAIFVAAGIERLPAALTDIADRVTVNFPWGSLLRGLLTADAHMLASVAAIMKPGAALTILLSVTEHDRAAGPAVTETGLLSRLVAPYAAAGLAITGIAPVTATDVVAAGSSWGKRLGAGSKRIAWRVGARRVGEGEEKRYVVS